MTKISEFVERQLEEKKQIRWVIPSNDLFDLFSKMGIMDDEDTMMDILEYLEDKKIDIHFENNAYLGIFSKLEQGFKIKKQMKGRIEENKKLVEKTLLFKPKVNDDFLLEYRTDDEDEQEELRRKLVVPSNDIEKLSKKIIEMCEKSEPIDSNLIEHLRNNS